VRRPPGSHELPNSAAQHSWRDVTDCSRRRAFFNLFFVIETRRDSEPFRETPLSDFFPLYNDRLRRGLVRVISLPGIRIIIFHLCKRVHCIG